MLKTRPPRLILFSLVAVSATAGALANAQTNSSGGNSDISAVTFRFSPVKVNGKSALHVEEWFRATQPETKIIVPVRWGSADHLEKQTQNLKIETTSGTLTDDALNAGAKLLHARTGRRVILSYDIVSQQIEPFRNPQEHMAIIYADYFLFNPQNALVIPSLSPTSDVVATFDWKALPETMPILTSFGMIRAGDRNRVISVRAPWFRIVDGLLAGGDFRVSESHEGGTTVVLAARGKWQFSDADALAKARRIVDEENHFWRAAEMPYFLVTLAPFDVESGDEEGSEFTNAFMLFLSRRDEMDTTQLQLMAHEMFHHWNPSSMGPRGADEVAQWFAEGFTIYYAGAITLRGGLTTYSEYLDYLNRWLRRYEASPLRNLKEADWKAISHSNGPGYELSYERGAAIALWADAAIRARSHGKSSLDNVMFDLVQQSHAEKPPRDFTEERVLAAFSPYLSNDELTLLRGMAIEGADVPFPERLGICALRQSETLAIVDPGFDQETSFAHKRVTGVEPDGPAYRAGIRDGQELFRWSIYKDDPSKDALLGIVVDGDKKTITFSPAKQMVIPQYRATVDTNAAESCTPF